jgi:hypothetical protein
LPFLRFTRDKRGYETISLVHAGRRDGKSRPRVLYWFRTPPGVKVGRPAIDPDAIRLIEEQNPDIEFDWPRILESQPPPAPAPEDPRQRRGRRERPKSDRRRQPQPAAPARPASEDQPVASAPTTSLAGEDAESEVETGGEIEDALEQLTHPDAEEAVGPVPMPVEQAFGPEQLTRLRARHAELLARIAERGGTPERIEELRMQAEALNPDTWVTDEEVRRGTDGFESKMRELRSALGLRRRRRRGRRPKAN